MRRTLVTVFVFVSILACMPELLAQGGMGEFLTNREEQALDRKDFEAFLDQYGDDFTAEIAFGEYLVKLERKNKPPEEQLPYYEFHDKRWGVHAYGDDDYFDKLTELRFLVARAKGEWKHPELCESIWKLVKEKEYGKAIQKLREHSENHSDCEMCALSFSKVLLQDPYQTPLEKLLERIPLAEEMLKRFPLCVNTAIAIETLTGRFSYRSEGKLKAFELCEKLLKVAKSPACRFRVLGSVAHYHLIPDNEGADFKQGQKYYKEVLSLPTSKKKKQEILFDRASALHYYANKKNQSLDSVFDAYAEAIMVDPKDGRTSYAVGWFVQNLVKNGNVEKAEELALKWFERAKKDASFAEVAAAMLYELGTKVLDKDKERGIEFIRKAAVELPFNRNTAIGLNRIATAYGELQDEQNMLKFWKKLAFLKHPPEDLRYGCINTSLKQHAAHRIAEYYEEKENLKEALKWYRLWEPFEVCGSCLTNSRWKRQNKIKEIGKRLGIPIEQTYLSFVEDGLIAFSSLLNLIDMYKNKGKLDELKAAVQKILKENPANMPVKRLMRYFGFRTFVESGDFEGLFEVAMLCGKGYLEPHSWQFEWGNADILPLALKAFASESKEAFVFLRRKIDKNWDGAVETELKKIREDERDDDEDDEEEDDDEEYWEPFSEHRDSLSHNEAELSIYALGYFTEKEVAVYLVTRLFDIRKAYGELRETYGSDLEWHVKHSLINVGASAAELMFEVLESGDKVKIEAAQEVMQDLCSDSVYKALNSLYGNNTHKKLETLYSYILEIGRYGSLTGVLTKYGKEASEFLVKKLVEDVKAHKKRDTTIILLGNFPKKTITDALHRAYMDDVSQKVEALYSAIGKGRSENLVEVFKSIGVDACLFTWRIAQSKKEQPYDAQYMLNRFPREMILEVLKKEYKEDTRKKLKVLYPILWQREFSDEGNPLLQAFCSFGKDACSFIFERVKALYKEDVVLRNYTYEKREAEYVLKMLEAFPKELTTPRWKELTESEDKKQRELAERELEKLKEKEK